MQIVTCFLHVSWRLYGYRVTRNVREDRKLNESRRLPYYMKIITYYLLMLGGLYVHRRMRKVKPDRRRDETRPGARLYKIARHFPYVCMCGRLKSGDGAKRGTGNGNMALKLL